MRDSLIIIMYAKRAGPHGPTYGPGMYYDSTMGLKKKPQVISLTSLATSQSTGNNQGNLFYITTTGTPPLHSVFFVRCLHCAYRYVVLGVLCIYLVLRV